MNWLRGLFGRISGSSEDLLGFWADGTLVGDTYLRIGLAEKGELVGLAWFPCFYVIPDIQWNGKRLKLTCPDPVTKHLLRFELTKMVTSILGWRNHQHHQRHKSPWQIVPLSSIIGGA
jgi:hypothetical protein